MFIICSAPQKLDNKTNRKGAVIMTKYRIEERIKAAQAVMAGESIAGAARKFGICSNIVSRDVRRIEKHGEESLHNRAYGWTAEQKYQALQYMYAANLTCAEASLELGINGSTTIWNWEQRYLENGMKGLEDKKSGRKRKGPKPKRPQTREEELLERIQYLEAENDYLKKLNALVAEREKHGRESK